MIPCFIYISLLFFNELQYYKHTALAQPVALYHTRVYYCLYYELTRICYRFKKCSRRENISLYICMYIITREGLRKESVLVVCPWRARVDYCRAPGSPREISARRSRGRRKGGARARTRDRSIPVVVVVVADAAAAAVGFRKRGRRFTYRQAGVRATFN